MIKGVPLVHRGEVWLVSSQLKGRLLRERASYKSAIPPTLLVSFVVMCTRHPALAQLMQCTAPHSHFFYLLHCPPPSLLLFADACAAISWPVLPTPPSRVPGKVPRARQALLAATAAPLLIVFVAAAMKFVWICIARSHPFSRHVCLFTVRLTAAGSYAGHPVFSTLQGQTSLGRVLLR